MGFDNVPSAHHVSGGELLALFLQVPPEVHGVHLDQISRTLDRPVFGLSDGMRACLQQAGGAADPVVFAYQRHVLQSDAAVRAPAI